MDNLKELEKLLISLEKRLISMGYVDANCTRSFCIADVNAALKIVQSEKNIFYTYTESEVAEYESLNKLSI